jgi:RimJ/RimL family protein N-acetyltransferase
MTPVLLTERLLLRPFEHEDASTLAQLLNDPAVAVGVCSVPHPFTPLHAAAHILMIRAKEMAGTDFAWAVEDMDGVIIGSINLALSSEGIATLGYALAQEHWGQGFATEAVGIVLDWATRSLIVKELQAEVFTDSPASIRVLEKLGFVDVGSGTRFSLARLGSDETRVFARREAA